MKVLFVYKYLTVGGVETVLRARLDSLAGKGIDGRAWFFHDLGGRGIFRGCEERISLGMPADLASFLAHTPHDLVATFDTPEILAAGLLPAGQRVVVECHSPYLENLDYLRDLRRPPVVEIWVPSAFQRAVAAARVATSIPIAVLPNPLRQIFLDPPAPFPAPLAIPVVAWVGRMDELKNWRGFLALGQELLAQGFAGELWLAGKPVEAGVAAEIRRLARERQVLPRLRWFREFPHERLPRWLDAVRDSGGVVVSTSRGESFGMTVAEAMARGCAVAVPAMGPFPEFVEDERTGLLFAPESPADAARTVSRLLADPTLRKRIGTAARERVCSDYSPGRAAAALTERLLALGPSPRAKAS